MSADLFLFTGGRRERRTKLAIAVPEIIISAPDDGGDSGCPFISFDFSLYRSLKPNNRTKNNTWTNGHGLPFNFPFTTTASAIGTAFRFIRSGSRDGA